jgi:hypothetical protein
MKDVEKTYKVLLIASAVLFALLGSVMILFDNLYILGIQYLFSSFLFIFGLKKKIDMKYPHFAIGFIFMVIGLNINIGVWGLGTLLFILSFKNN